MNISKSVINKLKRTFLTIVTTISVMCTSVIQSYAGDSFETAGKAASNLFGKLYTLANKIFPLALAVTAIAMFFTRDDKKFAIERKILIGICGAFLILQIVNAGDQGQIVDTIKNLIQ